MIFGSSPLCLDALINVRIEDCNPSDKKGSSAVGPSPESVLQGELIRE